MTAERKTATEGADNTQTTQSSGSKPPANNVLHKYRLVNYIFTLAALTTDEVNDPKTYRGKALNCVILKSGGKGTTGMTAPTKLSKEQTDAIAKEVEEPVYDKFSAMNNRRKVEESSNKAIADNKSLVGEFNQKSPGRFDMFIDNVEIETVMARDKNSASTQPTKITFDVFEPYSINGFIEALQTAAQASGSVSYVKAAFVLKMEFIGYPDNADITDPIIEPYATRYFPIAFTGVDVTVDERGTKYNCKAVPVNEVHLGNPSTLKKPVKVSGRTVKEIFEDLVKSLSDQVKQEADDGNERPLGYDTYKVKFPSWDDTKGWVDTENQISSALVTEITEDKNLFTMPDPGSQYGGAPGEETVYSPEGVPMYTVPAPSTNTKNGKQTVPNQPTNPVVQFNEGKSVQECMEAIIRDSHYLRDRLEKLMGNNWKEVVKENMFDYFLIKLEVTEKPQYDNTKNKHYYTYTYVVTPYKMLYTKVPGFGSQTVDQSLLYRDCVRKYDYIYTGKNLDITNFKLNFNNLFFEAIPTALGNVKGQPGREAVSKTDSTDARKVDAGTNASKDAPSTDRPPSPPTQSSADLTNTMARGGGQPQQSPYYAMAQALHNAVVDSKASMITGDLDILGDPIYLVTGGLGSNNPKPVEGSPRVSEDGEAQFTYGDVLININFKNPIDIGDDGFYQFDSNLIPFSGVYQVTTAKSSFKDGQFKQSLQILRMPGQAVPVENPEKTAQSSKTPVSDPSKSIKQSPNPDDVAGTDSKPVSVDTAGIRPGTFNLMSQLDRSIPSPGLPGELSNFTAATGGLGGTVSVTQVSGANPNLPGVSRMISPLGISEQPAFGMPLPAKAAVGLQQRVYSPGGYVQQLGNNLLKSFGVSGPAAQLANQMLGNVGRKINSIPVLGSGIGIGASINIVKNNPNPQTTVDYQNQQLPSTPTATPSIAGVSGNALGYLANNLTAIPGITNNTALLTQSALQGNKTDPLAVAAAFGVNQAQLSGLSPNLTSKLINQLEGIAKNVPADTDLNTAVQNGVNVNGLTKRDIAALPPTAPFARSPDVAPDTGYINKLSATGGLSAVARAFGVNSINDVPQTALPADAAQTAADNSPSVLKNYMNRLGLNNPQDAAVLGLKLFAERKSLMGPTGILGSLEGNFIGVRNQLGPVNIVGDLGKSAPSVFGSKSSKTSPLDKIMIR